MNAGHEALLDDVAVYALGVLPASQAQRVREHIATCEECATEYRALAPAVGAIGSSAAEGGPSALVKARIMRSVRGGSSPSATRPIVWPAYLVAAACFAIAIFSSLLNLSLTQQLKSAEHQTVAAQSRSTDLAHRLAMEHTTIADLASVDAQRYQLPRGEVVRVKTRLYITLHGMPAPPRGKVYQTWTLAKGSKTMAPSVTFVPDARGAAVIALPVDAQTTAAVAISVEPEGGSKAPTSKPVVVQALN